MLLPLIVRGHNTGILTLARPEPHAFLPRDMELAMAFARQAAVAIENARLYERDRAAAVLEERQRLARELHDSVTQGLYSVTLYAEAAQRQLGAGNVDTAREHLLDLRATSHEALGEMRLLLFELHPPPLTEHGLGAALRARLSSVEGRSGLLTDARVDESLRLPEAIERELYRVAQEALNNVLKHAHARRVSVVLERVGALVRLEVADDGEGFAPGEHAGGLGLTSMHARAQQLNGTLLVTASPGSGTRVVVEVPG
jgi:signal transduction histidine kinase